MQVRKTKRIQFREPLMQVPLSFLKITPFIPLRSCVAVLPRQGRLTGDPNVPFVLLCGTGTSNVPTLPDTGAQCLQTLLAAMALPLCGTQPETRRIVQQIHVCERNVPLAIQA